MWFNFYNYNGYPDPYTATFMSIVGVVISILLVVAFWKIFQKAGEPGWKSIIPFYNLYTMCKIIWGTGWLFFLFIIPIVSFIFYIMSAYRLAKVFGKGMGYTLGIIFLPNVFTLILGFGNAQYRIV